MLEHNQNTEKLVKKSFGFVNNQFINIYSDDNPILKNDDTCYFLFYHATNYHRTIVASGKIVNQLFNDGMNIIYFISLEEFHETHNVLDEFVYRMRFPLYKLDETNVLRNKTLIISEKTTKKYLSENLFKIESFFVRKSLEEIKQLQQDYTKIIKLDILKQLKEIEDIIV